MDSLWLLLSSSPPLWLGVHAVLGLLVGSFLNVVIHRLPLMMERQWQQQARQILRPDDNHAADQATTPPYNLMVPRSACPQCSAPITALQNIPVLSYLLLKGRCANCSARISPRYPLVEAFTALLSVTVAWHFGATWYCFAALILTWSLIALAFIDFDHQLLPDGITLPLLWLGLLLSLLPTAAGMSLPVSPRDAIIGAAVGYLSLWSIYQGFKALTGKEGMGYGDFKLLAALGAWLGWQMLLPIILLAALAGAVIGITLIGLRLRDREQPVPFGPFLATAGWLALLWGEPLVNAYLRFSGLDA